MESQRRSIYFLRRLELVPWKIPEHISRKCLGKEKRREEGIPGIPPSNTCGREVVAWKVHGSSHNPVLLELGVRGRKKQERKKDSRHAF